MIKNSNSMTIWAESDTKGVAKQVLTFFFFWRKHPLRAEFKVNCTRNGGVPPKKRVNTCIAAAKCVPDFVSSPIVVLSSSVPFFYHKNVVSLCNTILA